MRIVVDAMGGDRAPGEVVRGAVEAAREGGVAVTLVGAGDRVRSELEAAGGTGLPVSVAEAGDVITMDDQPAQAIRRKKDSSLVVGLNLVKAGEGNAFVSAGSTGAIMAGGLLILGRIPGIQRPALGTVLPSVKGRGPLFLDLGAHMDSRPEHLYQYALMGSIYMEQVMGVQRPRVAILSVGTEEAKGNELTRGAHALLSGSGLNFVGNIEARDLFGTAADVVVCDGFVGNAVLKTMEGVAESIFATLKEEITRSATSKLAALALKPAFRRVARRLDYTEYGGALMLGINAPCIKCHGSSNAKAIKNGILVAREAVARNIVGRIQQSIQNGESAQK